MTDEQLDRLVQLKQKISDLEGIISSVNIKKTENTSSLLFGYTYTFARDKHYAKFNYKESEDILHKLANYYEILLYLEIVRLVKEIREIYPQYEVTNPTILKALNDQESMKKEIQDSLGNLGQILSSYI